MVRGVIQRDAQAVDMDLCSRSDEPDTGSGKLNVSDFRALTRVCKPIMVAFSSFFPVFIDTTCQRSFRWLDIWFMALNYATLGP